MSYNISGQVESVCRQEIQRLVLLKKCYSAVAKPERWVVCVLQYIKCLVHYSSRQFGKNELCSGADGSLKKSIVERTVGNLMSRAACCPTVISSRTWTVKTPGSATEVNLGLISISDKI